MSNCIYQCSCRFSRRTNISREFLLTLSALNCIRLAAAMASPWRLSFIDQTNERNTVQLSRIDRRRCDLFALSEDFCMGLVVVVVGAVVVVVVLRLMLKTRRRRRFCDYFNSGVLLAGKYRLCCKADCTSSLRLYIKCTLLQLIPILLPAFWFLFTLHSPSRMEIFKHFGLIKFCLCLIAVALWYLFIIHRWNSNVKSLNNILIFNIFTLLNFAVV